MAQITAIIFIVLWIGFGGYIFRNHCTGVLEKVCIPVVCGAMLAGAVIAFGVAFLAVLAIAVGYPV